MASIYPRSQALSYGQLQKQSILVLEHVLLKKPKSAQSNLLRFEAISIGEYSPGHLNEINYLKNTKQEFWRISPSIGTASKNYEAFKPTIKMTEKFLEISDSLSKVQKDLANLKENYDKLLEEKEKREVKAQMSTLVYLLHKALVFWIAVKLHARNPVDEWEPWKEPVDFDAYHWAIFSERLFEEEERIRSILDYDALDEDFKVDLTSKKQVRAIYKHWKNCPQEYGYHKALLQALARFKITTVEYVRFKRFEAECDLSYHDFEYGVGEDIGIDRDDLRARFGSIYKEEEDQKIVDKLFDSIESIRKVCAVHEPTDEREHPKCFRSTKAYRIELKKWYKEMGDRMSRKEDDTPLSESSDRENS